MLPCLTARFAAQLSLRFPKYDHELMGPHLGGGRPVTCGGLAGRPGPMRTEVRRSARRCPAFVRMRSPRHAKSGGSRCTSTGVRARHSSMPIPRWHCLRARDNRPHLQERCRLCTRPWRRIVAIRVQDPASPARRSTMAFAASPPCISQRNRTELPARAAASELGASGSTGQSK